MYVRLRHKDGKQMIKQKKYTILVHEATMKHVRQYRENMINKSIFPGAYLLRKLKNCY
jgi:hypothetical protein